MSNKIKYSFAIEKLTKKMVDASMVENGLNCNCICFHCGDNLVAINEGKTQRPHFRHDKNSNCTSNLESFYHWASKEILKDIEYINLPEVEINFDEFDEFKKLLRSYGINKNYRFSRKIILQNKTKLNYFESILEKEFNTELGTIRVDFVIGDYNRFFFIEPYYLNPIDNDKLKKLILLDNSTISISLISFAEKNNYLFSIEDFKTFLRDDISSKKWVLINQSKLNKLKNKYLENFKSQLKTNSHILNNFQSLINEKEILGNKIVNLNQELSVIEFKKIEVIRQLKELENKLNISYIKNDWI